MALKETNTDALIKRAAANSRLADGKMKCLDQLSIVSVISQAKLSLVVRGIHSFLELLYGCKLRFFGFWDKLRDLRNRGRHFLTSDRPNDRKIISGTELIIKNS